MVRRLGPRGIGIGMMIVEIRWAGVCQTNIGTKGLHLLVQVSYYLNMCVCVSVEPPLASSTPVRGA